MDIGYETDQLLNEYLLMHYGSSNLQMPWGFGPVPGVHFPVRTVLHFPDIEVGRALDLGCAVGRSSFEMSRMSKEVVGIDFSANFIRSAREIGKNREVLYMVKETGQQKIKAVARLPDGCFAERCHFIQGDVLDLPDGLGRFDRVHAANLICRLSDPDQLLMRLPDLVVKGGDLVLATPCTWLDEFSPEHNQPDQDTFEWLKQKLSSEFHLRKQANEPFLIRETARKFQWAVSLVTHWQKV